MSGAKRQPPKCCGTVVSNSAGGKDFWYCRGCRKEVEDKTLPATEVPPKGPIYWGNTVTIVQSGTASSGASTISIPVPATLTPPVVTHLGPNPSIVCPACSFAALTPGTFGPYRRSWRCTQCGAEYRT